MRYQFGDSNIITCYIKEMLHSFNLPKYTIYTKELEEKQIYQDEFGNVKESDNCLYDGKVYIKDRLITKYENGEFKKIAVYAYNYPVVNLTKNLIIKSSVYDAYTHNYLGDFLRFIRDYHGIDLMSMYNCFSGQEPRRLALTDEVGRNFVDINGFRLRIDTDDKDYDYYIVPIKFDKTYTFALNINSGYDIVSILHDDIFIKSTPDDLIKQSYMHVNGSTFSNPFTYSTKWSCTREKELWKKEKNLRLLMRVPKNRETSIVILEGDYTLACNTAGGCLYSNIINNVHKLTKKECEELNLDDSYIGKYINIPTNYFSKLSLLEVDDKLIHPFADKLIEYILRNAITSEDFISQNIEYVQDMIYPLGIKGYYGLWDDLLRYNIYNRTLKDDLTKGSGTRYTNTFVEYNSDTSLSLLGEKDDLIQIRYKLSAHSLSVEEYKSSILNTKYIDILPNSMFELVEGDSFMLEYSQDGGNTWINVGELSEGYIINNALNITLYNDSEWHGYEDAIVIGLTYCLQISKVTSEKRPARFIDIHTDVNGYVDKDVESLLKQQFKQGVK